MAVNKCFIIEADDTCPYKNLALEETLLYSVPEDVQVLYLWQNKDSVVIGQNQNPYAECDVDFAQEHSVWIARRMSGGGAVYQDLGNLNYTFLSRKKDYSFARNIKIILSALESLYLPAKVSGRNDILIDSKKISGNAFYHSGDCCLHHGTLLIQTDLQKMEHVLKVDKMKWESKGINSVRSRVENLCFWNKNMTVDKVKAQFKKSFRMAYADANFKTALHIDPEVLNRTEQRYRSEQFIWKREIPADLTLKKHFTWGNVVLLLELSGRKIKQAQIFTDALDIEWINWLKQQLQNQDITKLNAQSLYFKTENLRQRNIVEEVLAFIDQNIAGERTHV